MAEKKDSIRNLIEQGRRAGKLTSTEISDAMEESSRVIDAEQMEKLYEELLMDSEQDKMRKTAHDKIFVAPPMEIDLAKFYEQIQQLKEAAAHNDNSVVKLLEKMVPTYHPNRGMM